MVLCGFIQLELLRIQCRCLGMQLQWELQVELWVGAQTRGSEVLTLFRAMALGTCGPIREMDTEGNARSWSQKDPRLWCKTRSA